MLKAIRSSSIKDIDQLERIIKHVLSDKDGCVDADRFNRYKQSLVDTIEKRNPDKTQHYVVARNEDQKVIGYLGYRSCIKELLLFTYTSKPLEINALYVDTEEQGKGIGNLLMQYIRIKAEEKKYTEITLRSGMCFKESSWGFYERLGFDFLGTTVDVCGEEFGIFRLRL